MRINLLILIIIIVLGLFFSQSERILSYTSRTGQKFNFVESSRRIYIIVICLLLMLQSGLRNWGVGPDTYAYYEAFERVKGISWDTVLDFFINVYQLGEGKDPGYDVFQKIVQIVIVDYQLYLMLIATIFFTAFGNFIYKNTIFISDAILAFVLYSVLFYSFFSITGHRQTIATSFALFGFELIKKRKFLYFFTLIIVAATIHKSVLIFLPLYFLVNLSYVKFYYGFILSIFPILFLYRIPISNFFKVLGGYSEDYGIYVNAGTPVFTALIVLVSIIVFVRFEDVISFKPVAKMFYIVFALALFFTPLTWVNPSAMRVVQYFSIFMVVLIPAVVNSFFSISTEWRNFILVFVIMTMILVYIQSGGSEYKFFWQEMQQGTQYR